MHECTFIRGLTHRPAQVCPSLLLFWTWLYIRATLHMFNYMHVVFLLVIKLWLNRPMLICLYLCLIRNLQAAIGAYYDFESPNINTPSMSFVEDVTIGEGESVPPDTQFTKTWRIQNTGLRVFCFVLVEEAEWPKLTPMLLFACMHRNHTFTLNA